MCAFDGTHCLIQKVIQILANCFFNVKKIVNLTLYYYNIDYFLDSSKPNVLDNVLLVVSSDVCCQWHTSSDTTNNSNTRKFYFLMS